ncbi:hypothetical protein HanHA300_Chr16g0630911 [Helianthus annuus]|nr:hypothetical protein HanHA300_Chr16g0630911 [Helianthus annuus]KAJ0462319.1 hypothetical protein HanHA89_Chr16g0682111 [Helianthus annuus]KAJ0646595.1 hypothetical protein HanOQP8_Chr16g0636941 [Helianthus annuus]KAJ0823317.1 hypothetical protein HanPSC8_Chr16g0742331 [Helianthus annuus]
MMVPDELHIQLHPTSSCEGFFKTELYFLEFYFKITRLSLSFVMEKNIICLVFSCMFFACLIVRVTPVKEFCDDNSGDAFGTYVYEFSPAECKNNSCAMVCPKIMSPGDTLRMYACYDTMCVCCTKRKSSTSTRVVGSTLLLWIIPLIFSLIVIIY